MIQKLPLSRWKIGFTGTQEGLTEAQKKTIRQALEVSKEEIDSVAHGDCIGADAEFHNIAKSIPLTIRIFPPENDSKRAFMDGDYYADPHPYLERNRMIVEWCDELIACPSSREESIRSGTWSTIRYARKLGVYLCIIYPDGNI